MPTAVVVVDGLTELVAELGVLQRDLKPMMRKTVDEGLKFVEQAARNRAPVLSGLLKRSLGRRVRQYHGGVVTVGLMGVRKGVAFLEFKGGHAVSASRYLHLQEFGSVHQPPRPFMRPALDFSAPLMAQNMTIVLRDELRNWVARHT
jgi:HK97 gp10 family phage protein